VRLARTAALGFLATLDADGPALPDYVVLTLQLGMKTRQENPQENLASRI
jgi:hypothetical protein